IGICQRVEQTTDPTMKQCGTNPKYHVKGMKDTKKIPYSYGTEKPQYRTPESVIEILKGISDKDIKLLGFEFTNPINYILKGILVMPPNMRLPDFKDGVNYQHPFTDIYIKIIKINKILQEMVESGL